MTTLQERLRDCASVTFSAGLHGVERDCKEAAAELDRQAALLREARELLEKWVDDPGAPYEESELNAMARLMEESRAFLAKTGDDNV